MARAKSLLLAFLLGVAFSVTTVYLSLPLYFSQRHQDRQSNRLQKSSHEFKSPHPNLWKDLDQTEATDLYSYIHRNHDAFGLEGERFGHSTVINQIEVLRPNKSDVRIYLDGSGSRPERHARVSVVHTKGNDTRYLEYVVGPLPPSNSTSILPLGYPYHGNHSSVVSPISDIWAFYEWAISVGEEVSDITEDLFGAKVNMANPDDANALVIGARPTIIGEGQMVHWLEFYKSGARSNGRSLLPQGLYVKLYCPGSNPDTWTTGEWFYNEVIYENVTALRDAWQAPSFIKLSQNSDGRWTDTEHFESTPAGRSKPPPLSIQLNSARYDLDREQQYVSWMGFSFFLSTSQSTAMSLYDIRYDNTRLFYHIGLQEALAHYAGSEPMQSGLEFLDAMFGMGNMMFELVPGHDCPAYADYLNMTYSVGGQTFINRNAICIFEYTSDSPLQRHTAEYHVTVSRNTYLVVRSVSTVGNYDYTIDYIFYLDGSVEVKVRASGYIFGAYTGVPQPHSQSPVSTSDELRSRSPIFDPNVTNEYGYRIQSSASTSIHDHVLLFRCDFDISPSSGSSDSFSRVSLTPLTQTYPWDFPESPTRNTMHLTHHPLASESALNWPHNGADMYLLQSNETNRWGERKAYRIQPGTGMGTPAHLTILNSTALGRSASWSSADLWVLRNRDTEPMGAHYLNYLSPNAPLVDFADLANSEPLNPDEGDDLVLYFNLGGHHVPHSGDIPNTLMHTSASSVMLTPFNYFDEDVSKRYRQGVRVDGKKHDGMKKGAKWFGGRYGGDGEDVEMRLDVERDLEPAVDGYFEESKAGEVVRNKVGGGLWGLFGGGRQW